MLRASPFARYHAVGVSRDRAPSVVVRCSSQVRKGAEGHSRRSFLVTAFHHFENLGATIGWKIFLTRGSELFSEIAIVYFIPKH